MAHEPVASVTVDPEPPTEAWVEKPLPELCKPRFYSCANFGHILCKFYYNWENFGSISSKFV